VEMLEICSLLEKMANVVIIGIVPKDIESVKNDMTSEILSGFELFISTTLSELSELGVQYEKKDNIQIEWIMENFFKEGSFGNQI